MADLICLELRKLQKKKSFYVCAGIMVVMLILSAIIQDYSASNPLYAIAYDVTGVGFLKNTLSNCSFSTIICIFTLLFTCEDYNQMIVKTIYGRGYTRQCLYWSKAIGLLVAYTVLFLVAQLSSLVLAAAFFGFKGVDDFSFLALIATQYITLLAEVAMYYALCSVFRKIGISIALCLFLPGAVEVALLIVDLIRGADTLFISEYWISALSLQVLSGFGGDELLLTAFIGSLAYIVVFMFGGMLLNKRIDL